MKLSIVIPTYNEEKRIGATLKTYSGYFEALRKKGVLEYEILIVINNTQDKTESIVKSYQKQNKNIRFLNFKRGGKGYALIEGFKDALKRDNDLIGFTDADLATSPEAFYDLVKNIGKNEGVIANRYSESSRIHPRFSFRTLIVSQVFNFIVRSLFFMPFRDTQCGAKLFTRKAISTVTNQLTITQWACDIDLLYHMKINNLKVIEIPTTWTEKSGSHINVLRSSMQMFFAVVQLRLLNSPLKRFIKPIKYPVGIVWRFVK